MIFWYLARQVYRSVRAYKQGKREGGPPPDAHAS